MNISFEWAEGYQVGRRYWSGASNDTLRCEWDGAVAKYGETPEWEMWVSGFNAGQSDLRHKYEQDMKRGE